MSSLVYFIYLDRKYRTCVHYISFTFNFFRRKYRDK